MLTAGFPLRMGLESELDELLVDVDPVARESIEWGVSSLGVEGSRERNSAC